LAVAQDALQAESVAHELLRTVEGRRNPYPLYHRLRELAPVHQSETAHAWLLTRYEDCASALRDPRLGKDFVQSMDVRRPDWRERPAIAQGERSMLNTDGPYHTRLRKLVSKQFTPRSVQALRPRIEEMVDEHLDPMAEAGRGDLMAEFAFPLPVRVIGELLGVPEQDRAQFRDLVRDLTAIFELGNKPGDLDRADEAWKVIESYFGELIAEKRKQPDESLLGRLLQREDGDNDHLSDFELIVLASLLFLAGFETTTNLIGNGVLGLLRHPDQLEILRQNPDLFATLPDELLRYDGTVQMTTRFSLEDIQFGDVTIPAMQSVFMMVGAGNHDPARFGEPDRLDVTRKEVKPLTFGGGVHFCIGAALARLEIEIFFRRLLDRFGTIELDSEPEFRDRLTLRGLPSLELILREGSRPVRSVDVSPIQDPVPTSQEAEQPADGALPVRPSGDDRAWRAQYRSLQSGITDPAELAATIELLGRVPLFRGCRPEELKALASVAYPMSFDRGDELCVEGADAPECYVIAEGEAECTIGGKSVATVRQDDVVGELGPLRGQARAATVTATSHMLTYAISREELAKLVQSSPTASAAMEDELRRRYPTTS
jgi:cytochrome P450